MNRISRAAIIFVIIWITLVVLVQAAPAGKSGADAAEFRRQDVDDGEDTIVSSKTKDRTTAAVVTTTDHSSAVRTHESPVTSTSKLRTASATTKSSAVSSVASTSSDTTTTTDTTLSSFTSATTTAAPVTQALSETHINEPSTASSAATSSSASAAYSHSHSSRSLGLAAGLGIGIPVALAIVGGLLFWYIRNQRISRAEHNVRFSQSTNRTGGVDTHPQDTERVALIARRASLEMYQAQPERERHMKRRPEISFQTRPRHATKNAGVAARAFDCAPSSRHCSRSSGEFQAPGS